METAFVLYTQLYPIFLSSIHHSYLYIYCLKNFPATNSYSSFNSSGILKEGVRHIILKYFFKFCNIIYIHIVFLHNLSDYFFFIGCFFPGFPSSLFKNGVVYASK
jgi:hypothetical protein